MILVGRQSSHFTRVPRIVAHALGVPLELRVVDTLTHLDAEACGGNPALKIPTLLQGEERVFGAENICRVLAEHAGARHRVALPEDTRDGTARNAQELIFHAMAAQVQWVFGTAVNDLPADHLYFHKGRAGLIGALGWLEANGERAIAALPPCDVSLLEVTLFCLVEHLGFRGTLSLAPHPRLARFMAAFAQRPSAQATQYRFDPPQP